MLFTWQEGRNQVELGILLCMFLFLLGLEENRKPQLFLSSCFSPVSSNNHLKLIWSSELCRFVRNLHPLLDISSFRPDMSNAVLSGWKTGYGRVRIFPDMRIKWISWGEMVFLILLQNLVSFFRNVFQVVNKMQTLSWLVCVNPFFMHPRLFHAVITKMRL